jgi:GNAT superfamily N-acetyltransferase
VNDGRAARARDPEIERAGPADADGVLALINHIQPHVPWDHARFGWQFLDPPSGAARLYVLRDTGRIAALYAAIPQRLWTGERTVPTWMVQDVMTHPDYRGRGFLHRLGERCLSDMREDGATGYTFPNKLSEGSFRRLQWAERSRVPRRTAAVRAGTSSLAREAGIEPLHAEFDERDTRAWEHADAGTGVHRDAAFLSWRYRKPHTLYERFRVGADRGFLVLKQYDGDDGVVMHVCDLVIHADARELVEPALAFAHDFAARAGAVRLTAWLPADHPYASAFERAGLRLDTDHDRYMFVTGLNGLDRWHVTQGDSDVY